MDTGERGSRITGIAPGSTILQAKPENWPSVTSTTAEDIPSQIAAEFFDLRLFDDRLEDWRRKPPAWCISTAAGEHNA